LFAVVPAFLIIWVSGEKMAGSLLVFSQVVLSFQLGFALIPLIHWVSSKRIMGDFRIRIFTCLISWMAVAVILGLNVKLVIGTVYAFFGIYHGLHMVLLIILLSGLGALVLLAYITFEPIIRTTPQLPFKATHENEGDLYIEEPEPFNRIAIPVDFTPSDQMALNYAIAQGGKEAQYFLIHIVESAGARMLRSEITDRESSDAQGLIARYSRYLRSMGFNVRTVIDYGLAGTVIPEVISKVNADLLVMSSHRKGRIHRMFKGTTIIKVQRRTKIPMIIIK